MKRGVTGGIWWTIVLIIIGIVAIALFWLFFKSGGEKVSSLFSMMVTGFKETIRSLLGPLGWLMGW